MVTFDPGSPFSEGVFLGMAGFLRLECSCWVSRIFIDETAFSLASEPLPSFVQFHCFRENYFKFFFSLRSHRKENPGELERGFALIRLSGLEKERNCIAVLRENDFSANP